MVTLDIIILVVIGIGVVSGFMQGFIRQLSSLLGMVAGLVIARSLYSSLALKLCPSVTESMTLAQILAFILIWLAVPLTFSLVASLLTRLMEIASLGWLNRWLGSGLGALKCVLVLSLLIGVIDYIDSDRILLNRTQCRQSVLYHPIKSFSEIFFPTIHEVVEDLK